MTAATDAHCRVCGSNTVVAGGCCACGAGVREVPRGFMRKPKRKPHTRHEWGYVGITTETGVRARKEHCTRKGCPATRMIELGD